VLQARFLLQIHIWLRQTSKRWQSQTTHVAHLQCHNCPARCCNWCTFQDACHRLSTSSPSTSNSWCLALSISSKHQSNHRPPHFAESLSELSALVLSSHMRLLKQSSPIILGLGNDDAALITQFDMKIERFAPNTMIETVFWSSALPFKRVMSLLFSGLTKTQSPFPVAFAWSW
jgi:hypothetical protein